MQKFLFKLEIICLKENIKNEEMLNEKLILITEKLKKLVKKDF